MSELELAKYPGLVRRDGGVWYVRKRVPDDLRHILGSSDIRRSLKTPDRKEAVGRYHSEMAEIEGRFRTLRAELEAKGTIEHGLSTGRIDLLGRAEVEKLVAEWWGSREAARRPLLDEFSDRRDLLAAIREEVALLAERPEGDVAMRLADQLLVKAGAAAYPRRVGTMLTASRAPAVDRTTEQYRYLCELVGRALRMESVLAADHLLGRQDAVHDRLFNPMGAKRGAPEARTVRDLIAEYRKEREALRGKESTHRKYGLLFRAMKEVWGDDMPVQAIGRPQCIELLSFLKRVPPNVGKRFPRLSLTRAVAKADAEGLAGLAPNTVGSYMQGLVAILRWAADADWGVKVNTRDLVETRRAQVKRRGFQPGELQKLFGALRAFRETEPTKYWVPALALFTGARAGEICQLRSEDVVTIGGIYCLNLSEFDARGERVADKRLKTRTSERYVPLHPALIEAGFLKFVERQDPKGRLFPDLKPGPKNSYSHDFSKWFGRFKKRIGFNEPALVFHSFRHGFRDACRHAEISDETGRALGGWAGINQATHYGDRGAVPVLDRAMRKLEFGEFKLPPATRLPPARERAKPAA